MATCPEASREKMAADFPAAKRSRLEDDTSIDEERQTLLSSLFKIVKSLKDVVEQGERDRVDAGGIEDYIKLKNPRGIKLMFKPMPIYAECLSNHKVNTWKEVEKIITKHYRDGEVHDVMEELLSAEENYARFFQKREEELSVFEMETSCSEIDLVTIGKEIPKDLVLMDAQSGNSKPLVSGYCSRSMYTLFILMRHYG